MPRDHSDRRYRRFFGGDPRRDIDEELEFHFSMRADELRRAGLSTEEAQAAVMKRFGNADDVRSEVEEIARRRQSRRRRTTWLETLRRDVSFALRTLPKSPAFTVTAVLTMALGIGASAAIFSVVNAVLLRPLHYAQPDRLAFIWTDTRSRGVVDGALADGDLPDLMAGVPAFESIAGIANTRMTLVGDDGRPDFVPVALVTPNFFQTLGAHIRVGRDFTAEDGRIASPSATVGDSAALPRMMILSYDYWQQRFGGNAAVLGRTFMMSNALVQVVGVAPSGSHIIMPTSTSLGRQPAVFQARRADYSTGSRTNASMRPFGRLGPHATIEMAQRQLDRLSSDLREQFPTKKVGDVVMRAAPMQADLVKGVRPAILSLMGAVLFVLLIACANVANLMLVRASARERELAVRAALGGTRSNLVAQVIVECVVLSIAGAAVGVGLAAAGMRVLPALAPSTLPRIDGVDVDGSVVTFATLAAMLSSIVFGLVPALRASRPNLLSILRTGGRSPSLGGGARLRQAFVVVEVALSFALLVGAGLMVKSFVVLTQVDPGFDPGNAVTFTAYNAEIHSYEAGDAYASAVAEKLAAIPGVVGVTAGIPLPLDGLSSDSRWGPMAAAGDASRYRQATSYIVRPGFFAVLKTRLIAGHDFTAAENVMGNHALIVDDLLASRAFPGQRPETVVGQTILARVNTAEPEPYQIIGVVAHQRHLTLAGVEQEGFYLSTGEARNPATASRWIVRSAGDPAALARSIPRAVAEVAPRVPVADMKPMTDFIDRVIAPTRFALVLIGVFGSVALVLAAIGLYGVVSTSARQRTGEIGIRMAFGATTSSIFRLIVGQALLMSAIGLGAGLLAALALTGAMARSGMLVSVPPTDPVTYCAMAILFAAVAMLACWRPAHRAAQLDPVVALRET